MICSPKIEQDNRVAVVVFDSADPDFFLAHYDIAAISPRSTRCRRRAPPSTTGGLPHPAEQVFGGDDHRSAGQGSRCGAASSPSPPTSASPVGKRAVLGQFEVGFAAVPGGGPSTRLPGIVGRGRAFEILLGGEDFDGELAERYGYVNRAVPDAQFVEFVNAFAERVSRFNLLALADIKRFVNAASLPADDALTAEMDAFAQAVARPITPSIIEQALEQGFQQRSDRRAETWALT